MLKNGARTVYTYDEVGRLESLVNYDPDDWVISSCGYLRNDVGCPTRITYQDGRRRDYAYDDLYRLTREEHCDAQANSLLWHNYTYDEAGDRTEKLYDHAESGDKHTYAYDALNQVSTLTATGTPGDRIDVTGTVTDDNLSSVTVYNDTLDPVGAFEAQLRQMLFIARSVDVEEGVNDLYALALDKSSNESRYPASGYHTVTLADQPDPNLDYVFDANGCLVEVIEDTTTLKEYAYDFGKRLVEVKHGGIVVARFQYDGLGRRVVVRLYDAVGALDSERRFIYDGGSVIEEYVDDTGTWVFDAAYIHGLGIDNVLAVTHNAGGAPSTYCYYHYDGIGSVTELTDAEGALAQAYEYDAWGIATIYDPDESTIANPYMYTGRRWDAEIGLYYYRARHYAPHLGRFLQADPQGYGDGPNLYLYVLNAPTAFVDPSGLRHDVNVDDRKDWSRARWFWYELSPVRMFGLRGKESQEASAITAEELEKDREHRRLALERELEIQDMVEHGLDRSEAEMTLVKRYGNRIPEKDCKEAAALVQQLGIEVAVEVVLALATAGGSTVDDFARMGLQTRRARRARKLAKTAVRQGKRNVDEVGGAIVRWGDEVGEAATDVKKARGAGRGITTYADETGDVLEESHRLRALSKPSSEKLVANLRKAGIERPGRDGYAVHHIVAGKHPRAARAREILMREGIDINDATNGIFLPTAKEAGKGAHHPSLHTKKYFRELTRRLEQCEKGAVRDELKRIAEEIAQDNFPH